MADEGRKYPPEVVSIHEGPELGRLERPIVLPKPVPSDYPLIDCDPHIKRVMGYARPSDYAAWGLSTAGFPAAKLWMERLSPSGVSRQSLMSSMRLSVAMGFVGGFLLFYSRSVTRFYGWSENRREIDMDMREMVDKVKRGESLYGTSELTTYMQAAAHRKSRYSGAMMHILPWFNFVNHPYHGIDTAKYYRQAELELDSEGKSKA